jgi:Spy/CpxP family protein refolding chaperone
MRRDSGIIDERIETDENRHRVDDIRNDSLGTAGGKTSQQLTTEQTTIQQMEVLQAQIASLKADEIRSQVKLVELLKTYQDSHPNVMALRRKLDRLRAQEHVLSQAVRRLDALSALKQTRTGLQTGLPNRWWKNAATTQSLRLALDQLKKMDEVFQQSRLKLIDLNAALEREEVTLEPLVAAETLDESRMTAEIDRVGQARAELERANGRMLLGIRKLLTPEQWSKLSQLSSPPTAAQR